MEPMKNRLAAVPASATLALGLIGAALTMAQQGGSPARRPQGPCDIYGAAGDPCVAAHSTTRALYASYNGPLYRVLRQSDGKTLDIGVVPGGGYADSAAQDAFCANTHCWIATIYDQSPKHNHLTQAPRGGFSGPAMGGFNNLPLADMAPIRIMGHQVYGVFIEPGMGLRNDDPRGTAVDDQAEGQYWVVNGHHYNSGCCFDYGNAEIDSRDDDNGTMETTYFGTAGAWYHGPPPGPWVMTDQENNLVGCVTTDGTKNCSNLPSITWRFVTAMAKGEPHHWTSLGGDAQRGRLSVMFDGPRVNSTYDPMRKQGAILLGNGGDNSNGSQGTFYEGAMTAGGTFPTDATDQLVQANVVAARYEAPGLTLTPSTGLQTFSPGSSQDTTVTFTNTSDASAEGVSLSLAVPKGWTVSGSAPAAETLAPGASRSVTFRVHSGPAAFNGDLVAKATWKSGGRPQSETLIEKVRNVSPVKINEFRTAEAFIELYNAGDVAVDLSGWTLAQHPAQQPIFSTVAIPPGSRLAAHSFYLLGLSGSGLAVDAHQGDSILRVSSTSGMSVGDTIEIDTGSSLETRQIAAVGTAAGNRTTVWQPLPDGPITIPAGSTGVPVTSVAGFEAGEKIAIGYGAGYPAVGLSRERFEVATVAAVGKPGTQAFLGADVAPGATNIKVTSVANISAGDRIRLDIDSTGHGIETVTVAKVGTQAIRTALIAAANPGATNIKVRGIPGAIAVGDRLTVGTPANREIVTVTAVGAGIDFTPALAREHGSGEGVVDPGTGLDLAAPLKFAHAANLPFSVRGTGITFQPETAFAHSSNEPVQPLGTGIRLDRPLARDHAIDAAVRDSKATASGYQGTPAPNQWFGGPAFSPSAGAMVLRDAKGLVVDSLNYGGLTDPWAAAGYQAESGSGRSGCYAASPGPGRGGFALNRSAGRFPDGADTGSNCADFRLQTATALAAASAAGTANLKVAGVTGFAAGQEIRIDSGANAETAVIATVGSPGATTASAGIARGATVVPVANAFGFSPGETVTIDGETATIASAAFGRGGRGATIRLAAPLAAPHEAGAPVSGSGLTLAATLTRPHEAGTTVAVDLPTPGAPNRYANSGGR
jgi:hypothetical protein